MDQELSVDEQRLTNDSHDQGNNDARAEAVRLERKKFAALVDKLLMENRVSLLLCALDDKECREKAFKYYFPNGVPDEDSTR